MVAVTSLTMTMVYVRIAGDLRTWTWLSYKRSECADCGSQSFKQSKLTGHYFCNGCNKNFEHEKPWFYMIDCSMHGRSLQFDPEYWCEECEDDDRMHHFKKHGHAFFDAKPAIIPVNDLLRPIDHDPATRSDTTDAGEPELRRDSGQ